MNGADGGSAGLGQIDHLLILYYFRSYALSILHFPSVPIGDYDPGTLSITCPV